MGIGGKRKVQTEGIDTEVGLEKKELEGRNRGLAGKQQREGCCVWRQWAFATKEETRMEGLKCSLLQKE